MKNGPQQKRLFKLTLLVLLSLGLASCGSNPAANSPPAEPSAAQATPAPKLPKSKDPTADLQVFHYFNDSLGQQSMEDVIQLFQQANPKLKIANNPMDHETFKFGIPVMLQSDEPPDAFSYWAGARVQAAVDAGGLQPLDELWEQEKLEKVFPKVIAASSTYNGKKYVVPIGYHYVAFFYNKKLFTTAGAKVPQTWAELKALAEKFKQAGVPAFALGSRERWPAQFWFDYLLLRTAGPTYRAELMAGQRSYTAPEVKRVMQLWQELLDAGYFYPDANAYNWEEAAKITAQGQAAMTLIGTWITGYYKNTLNLTTDKDYGYFTFPLIDKGVPLAGVSGVDCFMMAKKAQHPTAARKLLTFLASPAAQKSWTVGQGALPPSKQVSPKSYDPLIQRLLQETNSMPSLAFNYDLATTPLMAEAGLEGFSAFISRPSDYLQILQTMEKRRLEVFKAKPKP